MRTNGNDRRMWNETPTVSEATFDYVFHACACCDVHITAGMPESGIAIPDRHLKCRELFYNLPETRHISLARLSIHNLSEY